jgi:hypothetical protein
LHDLDQAAAMQQLLDLGVEPEDVAETVHTTPENVRAWADLLRLPRKVRRLIEMVNDPHFTLFTKWIDDETSKHSGQHEVGEVARTSISNPCSVIWI